MICAYLIFLAFSQFLRLIIIALRWSHVNFEQMRRNMENNQGINSKQEAAKIDHTAISSIKDLTIEVEELRFHDDDDIIGEGETFLALKSPTSYMIGTNDKGIELIEDDELLFSDEFPVEEGSLKDVIYVASENFYLLNHDSRLYRKDFDGNPPYPFMDINCGGKSGASFLYSSIHHRLVINHDFETISVVNLDTKKVEFSVEKSVGDYISDFQLLGEDEDRVVYLTDDGHILVYQLLYDQKSAQLLDYYRVSFTQDRKEYGLSIAVCPRSKYLIAEIADLRSLSWQSSQLVCFQISEDTIVKKAIIDQFSHQMGAKYALKCIGYFGSHLIWIGFSFGSKRVAQMYDFDLEKNILSELEGKRVSHEENSPLKICSYGDGFYYTGSQSTLMKLSIMKG